MNPFLPHRAQIIFSRLSLIATTNSEKVSSQDETYVCLDYAFDIIFLLSNLLLILIFFFLLDMPRLLVMASRAFA